MENLRIIIVEDDVFIRLDLMTHLMAAGHAIVGTADSAAEAVSLAEREHPDLVLMDVRLVGEGDGPTSRHRGRDRDLATPRGPLPVRLGQSRCGRAR